MSVTNKTDDTNKTFPQATFVIDITLVKLLTEQFRKLSNSLKEEGIVFFHIYGNLAKIERS